MASTPSSGSMTSPVPEISIRFSLSAQRSSASSLRMARSIRQSWASSTAARGRLPEYWVSLSSNFSDSAKASATLPAKPITTLPPKMRRTFFAVAFMMVFSPMVTWPSPAMAMTPSFFTAQMVVPRKRLVGS